MKSGIYFIVFISFIYLACSTGGDEQNADLPSGETEKRSELATLMRTMQADMNQYKDSVLNGGLATSKKFNYEILKTAEATDPKDRNETFFGYADLFLVKMDSLNFSDSLNRVHAYNNVISTCLECHYELCPGPVSTIKKMYK